MDCIPAKPKLCIIIFPKNYYELKKTTLGVQHRLRYFKWNNVNINLS